MKLKEEKTHLSKGKRILSELGYNCEIGANDVFVYLPKGDYADVKAIEKDLAETAGCSVWVIGV